MSADCKHVFAESGRTREFGGFWPKRRYRCVRCGLITRRYDGIDRTMTRPVHPHMSVALPGYNTTSRKDVTR